MVFPDPKTRTRFNDSAYRCPFPGLLFALFLTGLAAASAYADQADTADVPTPSPEYRRLETALDDYRRIQQAGGWPSVPPGPTIEPGNRDQRIPTLARRLELTGDLDRGASFSSRQDDVYDEELQAAVHQFQLRHGLEPDKRVGRATLRELNVPAGERVEQLLRNLERTRRVFDAAPKDFLFVNVPAFEARLIHEGRTTWTTRVIIGEADMETPTFETALESVVLNPTWTVPRKIATEEFLPKIQADRAFLSRGGYAVLGPDGSVVDPATIDWSALGVDHFPYRLLQQAGPVNELGQVKFLMPNEHGVCMHDTPGKRLFTKDSRAFSHGCVRVDRPLDLAERLLARYGWTREQIDAELATAKTRSIRLDEPLPVIITYLTAFVGADGTVFFYRDIYGRD